MGEQVELGFENVELTSSSFFNLFGQITEGFGEEIRRSHVFHVGLNHAASLSSR
jgi:hypothetical protein